MVALTLALTLATTAAAFQQAEPRETVAPVVQPPALVPHGTASGSWVAPTFFEEGILTALMVDAAGTPLYVLDGRISESGQLYGSLRLLEYASNPALHLPTLIVSGQTTITGAGDGTFWATILSPVEFDMPVRVFGRIEGLLLPGGLVRLDEPAQEPAPSGVAELFGQSEAELAGPQIVICPEDGGGAHLAAAIPGEPRPVVGSEPSLGGIVIVCPHAPAAHLVESTLALEEMPAAVPTLPVPPSGDVYARWVFYL